MSYRVTWSPEANERFERILRGASDSAEVTAAVEGIDRSLATSPKNFGESRDDTLRIGYWPPLGVLIDVFEDIEHVVVYDVWRTDRK